MTTYVCPKCGQRVEVFVRLSRPPTCTNQRRHTAAEMKPPNQEQLLTA